jgi:hypothetical protein
VETEVESVKEYRTLEVVLKTKKPDGTTEKKTCAFRFEEDRVADAEITIGETVVLVNPLRKAIMELVNRYPLEFEK